MATGKFFNELHPGQLTEKKAHQGLTYIVCVAIALHLATVAHCFCPQISLALTCTLTQGNRPLSEIPNLVCPEVVSGTGQQSKAKKQALRLSEVPEKCRFTPFKCCWHV